MTDTQTQIVMLRLFFSSQSLRIIRLSLIVCCVIPSFLRAEEPLDSLKTYDIQEITVTEQYRNIEARSASPLQILSTNQFNQLQILQVSDAMKHFSGVIVKDYGGVGGLKTVSVRSLGAAHTAVSYDGMALSDYQSGQIDLGRFSLDNVELLSLNIGQNDNIFQPAQLFAAASLLNIRSKTPRFVEHKTTNLQAAVKVGSFGLINPSFAMQQRLNQTFSLIYGGEYLKIEGNYPYLLTQSYQGEGTSIKAIRKNSDVENLRAEAGLYAQFSEKESAYLKAYYYHSNRGLPGATIFYHDQAFVSQRLDDDSFFAQAHYEKHFNQQWAMQLNGKYQYGYVHYLDTIALNAYGKEETVFIQNQYYTSASALYRPIAQFSLSFSTDWAINNMFANYEQPALTNSFAKPLRFTNYNVLAAKYVAEQFVLTGNLLSAFTKETVAIGQAGEDVKKLSPYMGITYKPFEKADFRVRAFYKNSIHLPTFNDLYYARVGNTNLKPEIADQFNIGLTYSTEINEYIQHFSLTADAYQNHVKDKIVVLPTQNLFKWTTLNMGEVAIRGLDATAELAWQAIQDYLIIFGGTFNYQRAIDVTDENNGSYGHQIPYTPKFSGSGRISITTPWIDLSYAVIWSGKRYVLFQNYAENALSAYSDHSLSANRNFKYKTHSFNFQVEALNIFNQNYAIVRWFPMPGRSFRASIYYKF